MTPPMTNDLNPAGVEAAARAIYDQAPNGGYVTTGHGTATHSNDFRPDAWEAATDRHWLCREMASAAISAYLASLPQPEGETAELVERLQPRWQVDEEVSRAVRGEQSIIGRGEALSRFLVANNALKREAADAITSLSQRLAVANDMNAGLSKAYNNTTTRADAAEAHLAVVEAERDHLNIHVQTLLAAGREDMALMTELRARTEAACAWASAASTHLDLLGKMLGIAEGALQVIEFADGGKDDAKRARKHLAALSENGDADAVPPAKT